MHSFIKLATMFFSSISSILFLMISHFFKFLLMQNLKLSTLLSFGFRRRESWINLHTFGGTCFPHFKGKRGIFFSLFVRNISTLFRMDLLIHPSPIMYHTVSCVCDKPDRYLLGDSVSVYHYRRSCSMVQYLVLSFERSRLKIR